MRGKVVHDHEIAGLERGQEDRFHLGAKALRVGGPFERHAGGAPVQPQRRHHGGGLPVAGRSTGVRTLAVGGPGTAPGQVRFGPRLIEENQPGRIPARLPFAPEPARSGNVRAVLLAGPEWLFLQVRPIFPSTTWMACTEQGSPVAARSSFKVRSFLWATAKRAVAGGVF